jgi:hypothetical protein
VREVQSVKHRTLVIITAQCWNGILVMTPSDTWRPTAAYFYLLQLDPIALAWEYLRRNSNFRRNWERSGSREDVCQAHHWGLRGLEDPCLDCRSALPRWIPTPPSIVRLTRNVEDANGTPFSLWKLPGRKALVHEGARLLLTVDSVPWPLLLALSGDVCEGMALDILLPATSAARMVWPTLTRLIALLERPHAPARRRLAHRPARESLIHMRTLQALDGQAAGATHREIASVIFGHDEVFQRWATNSELRAQMRYLLRRGHRLINGGYRDLLGTSTKAGKGDLPARSDSP